MSRAASTSYYDAPGGVLRQDRTARRLGYSGCSVRVPYDRNGFHHCRPMPRQDIKHKIMPFGQHLEELRLRLIYALVGVAPILIVSLAFGRSILEFVVRPIRHALRNANMSDMLQTTGVVETFGSYLK